MAAPVQLSLTPVGNNRYTINDHNKTVALVNCRGNVDWLIRSPMDKGPRVRKIEIDTHNCYTHGVKLCLIPPSITSLGMKVLEHRVEDGGRRLVLTVPSKSRDGNLSATTVAELYADENGARYEWRFSTAITCTGEQPLNLRGLEFNNVYPGLAGLCFLYAPRKQYRWTLMTDRDGAVWRFPHQHALHYGPKTAALSFAPGTVAGFFGEPAGSPVVIVDSCEQEPDWGICDMFYDLHCCCRLQGPMLPGQTVHYVHRVKYLMAAESEAPLARSRQIEITEEDQRTHEFPRLDLGFNTFQDGAHIDRIDDCSSFVPAPPQKVWDREVGNKTKGSLRITNAGAKETTWRATPPAPIPSRHTLNVRAMIKTQGVVGKGAYLRVLYDRWIVCETPYEETVKVLCSPAVTGTSDGWVKVEYPSLPVPPSQPDHLVLLEVVLDGQGVAWITDVDVDLQPTPTIKPSLRQDGSSSRGQPVGVRREDRAGGTM